MVGCGTKSDHPDAKKLGLVSGHAYSILGTANVEGNKLLYLRNPHGRTSWKGRFQLK